MFPKIENFGKFLPWHWIRYFRWDKQKEFFCSVINWLLSLSIYRILYLSGIWINSFTCFMSQSDFVFMPNPVSVECQMRTFSLSLTHLLINPEDESDFARFLFIYSLICLYNWFVVKWAKCSINRTIKKQSYLLYIWGQSEEMNKSVLDLVKLLYVNIGKLFIFIDEWKVITIRKTPNCLVYVYLKRV